jgi:hypothetical protein
MALAVSVNERATLLELEIKAIRLVIPRRREERGKSTASGLGNGRCGDAFSSTDPRRT